MKRSVLFSLTIIGAVVALVAGAATFAPFTTSDSDSGDVTAATLSITVEGTGTLDFSAGAAGCDGAILPGDTCGPDTVTVTNNSTVAVTLSDPTVTPSGDLSTCDGGGMLSGTVSNQSYTAGVTEVAASGGTATFDIEATLDALAGDDCQGDTGTITVEVTATNT